KSPDRLLFDRLSHPDFGLLDELDPCGDQDEESTSAAQRFAHAIVGLRDVEIAGTFDLATGFGAEGAALVSDRNYTRLFGGQSLDQVNLGLIRIRAGADPQHVAAELERYLTPDDVQVLTRSDILEQEKRYWVWERPIGIIFVLGLAIAAIVGIV